MHVIIGIKNDLVSHVHLYVHLYFVHLIFHLGTIAFGSLIIAIVKMIRGVLEYFEEKVKDKTGVLWLDVYSVVAVVVYFVWKNF